MTPRRLRRQRRAGFTLLEMLVVLAIIGLVAGTATALLRPPSAHLRVETAARGLCAAMRATRMRAIASNEEQALTIDVARRVYFSSAVRESRLPDDASIRVSSAQQRRSGSDAKITFFPSGRSSGADIDLDVGGQRATIETNWLTGETRCVLG